MSDYDNVVSGPASLLIDDIAMGHTEGGIEATITPQNRARNVDQFGKGECNIIHQGDQVRVKAALAEWTAQTLAAIYAAGNNQTTAGSGDKYMGIGRSAGFIYTAKDMKIVPLLEVDDGKRIQFYRVTPTGAFNITYDDASKDRIFDPDFTCLLDETKTDGELIGRIQLTAAAGGGGGGGT